MFLFHVVVPEPDVLVAPSLGMWLDLVLSVLMSNSLIERCSSFFVFVAYWCRARGVFVWYVPCSFVSNVNMGDSGMFHIPIMLLWRAVCFL